MSFLIQHGETVVPHLDDVGVDDKDGNKRGGFLSAVVLRDRVVATRQLHEALPYTVHHRWVAVHAAQELPVLHRRHDGRAAVPVGGREPCGGQVNFESDDGFPRCVFEFVIIQELDNFSGPITSHDEGVRRQRSCLPLLTLFPV